MRTDGDDPISFDVPDGWGYSLLDQLADDLRGISYGIVQPGQYVAGGVPIVRVNNLRNGRIDSADMLCVSSDVESKYERTRLRGGEVLLSLVGTLGECAVVPKEMNGWNVARAVGVIPLKPGTDPRWVAYCLRSTATQALMRAWATTTVQATLNLRDVRRLPILLAPEKLRSAITETVSGLDDKIEQNRRTAQALEKLARAIFRAWFVDFEPVKAKAAGATGFPSMPQPVFDALPTRLVDSAIGPVPEGWRTGALGDVFEIGLGGQWGSDSKTDKETYPARCLRGIDCHGLASGVRPDVPLRWLKPTLASRRGLVDGVVLVEGSGSFCGRSFLWRDSFRSLYEEDVLYSNFTKRLDPLEGVPNAIVAWYQMKDAYESDVVANFRTGSAFPNLDIKGMLSSFKVVIPDNQVALAFSELIDSFSGPCAIAENVKLAQMRDYLLLKLLSGQIRVRAAERAAATVA